MTEFEGGAALLLQRIRPLIRSRLPEFAAVVLIAMVAILGGLIWEYSRTIERVQHTVDVETKTLSVFSMVQDAESGSRGYVLTGEELYLQHYYAAVKNIAGEVAQLRDLADDNPEQQRTLANLEIAIEERFTGLKQSNDLRRTAGIDAAIAVIQTGVGQKAMEKVRADISAMAATESKLHFSRIANVQRVSFAGLIAASLALVVVIGSMTAWISNTRREARALLATIAERERNETQMRQMQKIEAVGQLTGGLAHDFNNMLAVIIGGLTLTQKRLAAGDTDVSKFVSAAMDGATRAATLTSRLMVFSRQQPLAPKPLNANQLVGGMLELLRRTLGETIKTEIVLGAELWSASVDPGQLENAILNLSVNARDAMAEGGKLTIETANCDVGPRDARRHDLPVGQFVVISATDNGMGMTADTALKAFDPFFTTKEVGKGTGLGLSQVHGFIKQSGGHVKIYSEPGYGTTVKMYLPRLIGAAARKMTEVIQEELGPELRNANSGHTILVVEDDTRVREISVSSLRELGYTVIHADGAKNGLEKLGLHPATTMLFTDIVMPEINGRQLGAEVFRRRPDVKILYTTGFARNAIVQSEMLEAGLHVITKPFTLVQLAAKVSEVLAVRTAG